MDVPHDFVLEGQFAAENSINQGFLPYGVGWYRKHFELPSNARESSKWIDFDGVMVACVVYINGHWLGNHTSGYTPFRLHLENSMLRWDGKPNLLAVRADASQAALDWLDSWYYEGGGIYRHVTLTVAAPVHIAQYGVYCPATVDLTSIDSAASTGDAVLNVSVDLKNAGSQPTTVTVTVFTTHNATTITDAGAWLSSSTSVIMSPNSSRSIVLPVITMPRVALWSVRSPALHKLVTEVRQGTTLLDQVNTSFGIRHIVFDPDRGFLLNNEPTKIIGACMHQDFGGVGTAVPDTIQWHRVRKLQSVGFNGWRTAHNPPTPALLDATDQLGMLVWDENHRVDRLDEVETLVRRDRNHPSVVIW